jgi:eukaryotic-like serine/threonine-protein kinase
MGNLVGQSLAHFRIVDKLGEGGMGIVYRATDEKLRRTVALKILPDSFAQDEDRQRRFLREARAAAAVTHPNIASVYEIGEAEGRIFIAMEYVEGETLRQRLGGGAVAIPAALAIALQIARGLAKAHQANVVHRDLKPENVIVGENDHVKLLDFGLAKLREVEAATPSALEAAETETNLTREGKMRGTPGYMSPEQARGQEVDARTDVFAFGVVLYEMLTGERPFVGETTQDVLTAVMRDTPQRASEKSPLVSREVDHVIERCLEKLRDARYANGAELLDAVSAVPPEPRVSEPGRKAPSRPTVSLVTPGATVAGESTPSPSSPRGSQQLGWRTPRVLLAGLAPFAILGVAGWRGLTRVKPATLAPTASVSPEPSASATGPTLPELLGGALPSSNPEAQRFFDEALRSFHDDTGQAVLLLESAEKADPSFGGAYLRLWSIAGFDETGSVPHQEDYHRRVLVLDTTLSARDHALLDALEDCHRPESACAKLDAYLANYPDDDMAWLARVGLFRASEDMLAELDRALSARPTLAPLLGLKARWRILAARGEEAAPVLERCLRVSPHSVSCLFERVRSSLAVVIRSSLADGLAGSCLALARRLASCFSWLDARGQPQVVGRLTLGIDLVFATTRTRAHRRGCRRRRSRRTGRNRGGSDPRRGIRGRRMRRGSRGHQGAPVHLGGGRRAGPQGWLRGETRGWLSDGPPLRRALEPARPTLAMDVSRREQAP